MSEKNKELEKEELIKSLKKLYPDADNEFIMNTIKYASPQSIDFFLEMNNLKKGATYIPYDELYNLLHKEIGKEDLDYSSITVTLKHRWENTKINITVLENHIQLKAFIELTAKERELTEEEKYILSWGKVLNAPMQLDVLRKFCIFLEQEYNDFLDRTYHYTEKDIAEVIKEHIEKHIKENNLVPKGTLTESSEIQGLRVFLKSDEVAEENIDNEQVTYTDILELIKALVETKIFDEPQKTVISEFEKFFHIKIKESNNTISRIKKRIPGYKTKFLDKLRTNLEKWIDS